MVKDVFGPSSFLLARVSASPPLPRTAVILAVSPCLTFKPHDVNSPSPVIPHPLLPHTCNSQTPRRPQDRLRRQAQCTKHFYNCDRGPQLRFNGAYDQLARYETENPPSAGFPPFEGLGYRMEQAPWSIEVVLTLSLQETDEGLGSSPHIDATLPTFLKGQACPPAALDIDAWNTLPEPREASDFPYLPAQLALKVCWLRCKERVPIDSSGASVQALRIETLRLPRTDDYWVARTLEAGVVVESRAFLPDLVRGNGREQGTTKVVSCQLSKYLLNLAESEALKPTSCALERIEVLTSRFNMTH